jgi:hypothetical protein
MKMSHLPAPKKLNATKPGSLVQNPFDLKWGICVDETYSYNLEPRSIQMMEKVLIADFGRNHIIWVESESLKRLDYPWSVSDVPNGALAIFDISGKAEKSIILGQTGDDVLEVFDLTTLKRVKRTSNDSSALCYTEWGIDLNCSDRTGDVITVYSFGGEES